MHNNRCKNAKSPIRACRCSCGGRFHAGNRDAKNVDPDEIVMSEAMGGEVAETIRKTAGFLISASSFCPHEISCAGWLGRPHDGGAADKDGKRWWMYLTCDECGYSVSFPKVLHRLEAGLLTNLRPVETGGLA